MSCPVPLSNTSAESRVATWLSAALIVAAAFAAYANSLRVPFIFDDHAGILENQTIRNLGDLGQVLAPPRNGSGVAGRPLVNLSLALNHAIGGTAVTGYHVANILLHALAGLALFGTVRRTLLRPMLRARFGGVARPIALASALLWVLHPLQTESVTCVIQRTELIVGVFYLTLFYCYLRAAEGGSACWTALAIAASFAGMASKEVMVTAPFLLLLHDRTFVAGSFAEAWRRRRGLYLGLGASLGLLVLLVLGGGGTRGEAAGFGVGVAWWEYALKQCEAILLYLKLTVWPHPLVLYYGTDVVKDPLQVWPHILGLGALVVGTLVALWRWPVLGFLGMWTLGILAPSSSVVPLVSQTVSEHRMYLPLAAPMVFGVAALFAAIGRRAFIVTAVATVAWGVVSVRRNTDYRSELAIWTDTVAKAPNNARARNNLGDALVLAGRSAEALAEFQAALRLEPNSAEARYNIGTILLNAGRPADAIPFLAETIRLKPNFARAHNNLGSSLLQTGRLREGIEQLQAALKLQPDIPEAHCNLARAALDLGDPAGALGHAERALAVKPGMALAHFHRASAFLNLGDPARAIPELEAAVRSQPDYAEALSNLGSLLYQAGRPAEAIPRYEAALKYRPNSADTFSNLASALFQVGRVEEAIVAYRAALRVQPDSLPAITNLALVLSRVGRTAEAIEAHEALLRLKPDDERARAELARLRAQPATAAPPR
ncbi:MAG: tetratricopeptide repeat protein [Opitutaceae bacterium]|nr:tetratricopeptide repeat protein [Opitutaceae bacterium]